MYTRLLQGYEAMDADQKSASAYAAKQLRLMVILAAFFLITEY
jgi:malonyl-CoA/methylmalonyl-CoA synthetase